MCSQWFFFHLISSKIWLEIRSIHPDLYLTCLSSFQLLYGSISCHFCLLLFLLSCSACMPLPLYEELVLNALATLNNLSYYDEPDSCVVQKQQEITECEDKLPSQPLCHFKANWVSLSLLQCWWVLFWRRAVKGCSSVRGCTETSRATPLSGEFLQRRKVSCKGWFMAQIHEFVSKGFCWVGITQCSLWDHISLIPRLS